MKFQIEITTDNDAFVSDKIIEISRILRKVTDVLPTFHEDDLTLRDTNGNKVGRAWWTQ